MAQKNVIILGGGYAGIIAANRLARKSFDIGITLVTANRIFAEKIRNHQIIAGTKQKTHDIAKLVHKRVKLIVEKVENILPEQNKLQLANGEYLAYDYLGYTPGMKGNVPSVGNDSYYSITNETDCLNLRMLLLENAIAKITVLGAGLSGIETATELAENYPKAKITLLDSGNIGKTFHQSAVSYMKKVLSKLKVTILEGQRAVDFQSGYIVTDTGEKIIHNACIVSAGLTASDLGKKSNLDCNQIGQVIVDEYMQIPEYTNILGAGDAIKMSGDEYSHLRMSCATALPMGIYMAERMSYLLSGKTEIGNKPFSFGYLLRCVSLGRKDGLVQSLHPDDSPKNKIWTGKTGALIKELICKFTIFSCKAEKYFDFYTWPKSEKSTESARKGVLAAAGK